MVGSKHWLDSSILFMEGSKPPSLKLQNGDYIRPHQHRRNNLNTSDPHTHQVHKL